MLRVRETPRIPDRQLVADCNTGRLLRGYERPGAGSSANPPSFETLANSYDIVQHSDYFPACRYSMNSEPSNGTQSLCRLRCAQRTRRKHTKPPSAVPPARVRVTMRRPSFLSRFLAGPLVDSYKLSLTYSFASSWSTSAIDGSSPHTLRICPRRSASLDRNAVSAARCHIFRWT